jgi:hypothetical protein
MDKTDRAKPVTQMINPRSSRMAFISKKGDKKSSPSNLKAQDCLHRYGCANHWMRLSATEDQQTENSPVLGIPEFLE